VLCITTRVADGRKRAFVSNIGIASFGERVQIADSEDGVPVAPGLFMAVPAYFQPAHSRGCKGRRGPEGSSSCATAHPPLAASINYIHKTPDDGVSVSPASGSFQYREANGGSGAAAVGRCLRILGSPPIGASELVFMDRDYEMTDVMVQDGICRSTCKMTRTSPIAECSSTELPRRQGPTTRHQTLPSDRSQGCRPHHEMAS